MKLLFVHDHRFILCQGLAYSLGKLSVSSFDRYLEYFDHVTILGRYTEINKLGEGYNLLSSESISFIPFDDLSTIKTKYLKIKHYDKLMDDIVRHFDGVVARVPSELAFSAARSANRQGKPYICEVVACPYDAMIVRNTFLAYIYAPIIRYEMKVCVGRASGVLYVTDSFLQERYPTNTFNVSASNVDLDEIIYRERLYDIATKDCIDIALVGNLDSPHKGYPLAYKFLSKIQSMFPSKEFIFHLVGGGERYKMNTSGVVYHGPLSKDEVFSVLDGVDIYIQPSTQEGLPRATIEAMSRGLPAVVSDVGGLPELVDAKFVHSSGNLNHMVQCFSRLMDDDIYWLQSIRNSNYAGKYLNKKLKVVRASLISNYYNQLK